MAGNAADLKLANKPARGVIAKFGCQNRMTIKSSGFWAKEIVRPLSAAVFRHSRQGGRTVRKEDPMLWTIAVILIILWALGLVSSYTIGGFIHILLVIAIIVILVGFISGRRS